MYGYNGQILKIVHFPAYLPRTGDIRLTYGTIELRKNEVLSVEILYAPHVLQRKGNIVKNVVHKFVDHNFVNNLYFLCF